MNKFKNLIENYKNKINEISKSNLNEDQKELIFKVMNLFAKEDECTEEELHNLYNLLIQRVKVGFTFDAAPGTLKDAISYLEKNEKLSFNNDFYKPKNQLIIGENFDALKNLILIERERERETLSGYDLIYIDPPYNTESAHNDGNLVANDKENISSNRFVYRDKFSRNGWLNMMSERLFLAKKLLKEDGLIFVSIDDNEQAYLKVIMDEIFGEENFVATIKWEKTSKPSGNTNVSKYLIDTRHEYIHFFAKNKNLINLKKYDFSDEELFQKGYTKKDEFFEERGYYALTPLWHSNSGSSFQYLKSLDYEIEAPDGTFFGIWRNKNKPKEKWMRYTWSKKVFEAGNKLGFIEFKKEKGGWSAYRKMYTKVKFDPKKLEIVKIKSGIAHIDYFDKATTDDSARMMTSLGLSFSFSKPFQLISHLINLHPNKNARILDFFAGSGTTAHSVLELNREDGGNRSYTLVTNNENNIGYEITYERLFRINNGKTTYDQPIKWTETNQAYNSNLDVFNVKYESTNLQDSRNINQIIVKISKMLSDFNIDDRKIEYKQILNQLKTLRKIDK
ncbi:site-specific DNA-methyltransferase [Mycoplasmopsis synoviae]|uniref:site-specific DNA-methyltransferase n=1 Tax=Mycoplasmopsis synoviae TaxID=2109 RepID=UPI0034DAFFF2